jgi:signal transduction histidine kinase
VTDDGIGFDVEASRRLALAGGSIGLVSMAERATLVGGALAIDSAPGCGTALRASFPLQCPINNN